MRYKTKFLEDSFIQLIDGDRGKNYPKQSDFKNEGHCLFLSAKNVTSSGFEFSETSFIDSDKDELLRAGKLERGDIVVTTRGTIGNVAFYDENIPFDHVRINSGMMIFRANQDEWNRRFLYFLLTSKYIKQQIKNLTSGSAVPQLPARDLKKFELMDIPKNVQDSIEEVLGRLVDKIQLNHQINQTLESISQALFKSWFVDFDPVKAKIEVLEAGGSEEEALLAAMQVISSKNAQELAAFEVEKPEEYAELRATAELFPAAMVDSELGEIPEGWDIWTVKDFGTVVCGKTPPKKNADYYDGDIPFIKIPDTHGKIFITDTNETLTEAGSKSQIKKLIPENTVCVSCIATVGQVFITSKPSHTNQQINSLIPQSENYLYYLLLKFKSMNRYFQDLASGGSTTLNMNTRSFSNIELLKPADEMLFEFDRVVNGVMEKILANQKECTSLANLRDTLLPKLLSGELDVSELADSLGAET